MPFTSSSPANQSTTPRSSSPIFKKINQVLSAAWGMAVYAISISLVLTTTIDRHTTHRLNEALLGLIVFSGIIVYMLKFSKSYPDRVAHHDPAPAPAGH